MERRSQIEGCLVSHNIMLPKFYPGSRPSVPLLFSLTASCVCLSQVAEISMGEFLMHSSVVWLNPHSSLGRMRKHPEMTVFGESPAFIAVAF